MTKYIISLLVLFSFISNMALATCDFSKGITPGPNNTFIYTKECHLAVGKLVQDNTVQLQQIADLNKALTLKDLALKESDTRAQLWMNTSGQLEDRLQKVDSLEKKNDWLYFGLGALTVIGTGFMVAKLINH